MKKRAALHNLGCKVNAYETEAMRQLLEEDGYEIVPFEPGADVYVINTCTVTNIADRKSRQMLHKARKMNPDAIVVAAGCYVETADGGVEKDPAIDIILGNNQNLINYSGNIALNIITCTLVFFGGIGFFVICELWEKRFKWKKFSMHTRIVISVSIVLIIAGALLLKITENISWMGAFFMSVSARTAGFATYSLGTFSKSGLLVLIILMIIGASPGSTGGGIKTSTFFALIQGVKSAATNKSEKAFHYAVPKEAFRKASVIMILAMCVVTVGSYLMGIFEPDIDFIDILFEVASAFGTAGLSTGITQQIGIAGKLLSIVIMYIGRLGPLTIATLWHFSKGERINYPEGNITIG